MKIGIVAGEASGDILGASLILSLREYYPNAVFVGIGGERMIAEGFQSLFPLDRLSVMGIVEPLKRLPELLSIRKSLFQYFSEQKIELFVGIDSPDFNLTLEEKLKKKGIKTVHYVSPSVWAWRKKRIFKIARAVDLMLTLLPFENEIYETNHVPVAFVGHPLADDFPLEINLSQAKSNLKSLLSEGYAEDKPTLACLPGSRGGEVKLIGPIFWEVIKQCSEDIKNLQIIVPSANAHRHQQIEEQLQDFKDLNITLVDGHSHEVMAAADVVLLASGTTALEAMLLKRPMVVAYKVAWFSALILSRMINVKWFSLPNLLANESLVPELIQDDVKVDAITQLVRERFFDKAKNEHLQKRFTELHQQIKLNASKSAAHAIYKLLEKSE
jgi:lipid-A-disaccharide synthase